MSKDSMFIWSQKNVSNVVECMLMFRLGLIAVAQILIY